MLIAVIALGVAMFSGGKVAPVKEDNEDNLGGIVENQKKSFVAGLFAGDNRQFSVDGEGNFVSGGSSMATTTDAAGTFTAAQVCNNNLIVATPNVGAVTLTFPTTTELKEACLPNIGSEKTIRLKNATTTTGANSILTLADGTGGDHQEQEGATTLVEGTEWAEITFMNIDGTNHLMLVTITQVAD